MDIGIISVRYAKALLKYAEEQKEEARVYDEMKTLAASFVETPRLQTALGSPVLSPEAQLDLLCTACSGEQKASETSSRFFRMVISNKRTGMMLYVANSFLTLYRKKHHLVRGRLVVSKEISEATKEKLKSVVVNRQKADVDFDVTIDPSIIGGFILEYGTYRLDASARTQLNQVRRALKA